MPRATNPALYLPASQLLGAVSVPELAPLVREEVQQRLAHLSGQFPAAVQTACYECRLGRGEDRVDLALCVFPPPIACSTSLDSSPLEGTAWQATLDRITEERRDEPHWYRTGELLREWIRPGSALQADVPFIWVAFDLPQTTNRLPDPCLGLCIDQSFFARRLGRTSGEATEEDLVRLANSCYQRLFDRCMSGETLGKLTVGLRFPGVVARHYSFMLDRAPGVFKLDVRLPVDEVGAFLRGIGWPEPAGEVQRSIRELMTWDGTVQLNLVLDPGLAPPLEVELMTDPSEVPTPDRFRLLDALIEKGLCTPEKAEVLRATWMNPLVRAGGCRDYDIARSWYVKVRFHRGCATEAKVYFGLMPRTPLSAAA